MGKPPSSLFSIKKIVGYTTNMLTNETNSVNMEIPDRYQTLLEEIVNYQLALKDPIAIKQLDRLDTSKLSYWQNYLVKVLQKLNKRLNFISIGNTICQLKRHINALTMMENLYIDEDGEIMVRITN